MSESDKVDPSHAAMLIEAGVPAETLKAAPPPTEPTKKRENKKPAS